MAHIFILTKVSINLTKITPLARSPLLICRNMGDLKKSHYWSHLSDNMFHPMKMAIARP